MLNSRGIRVVQTVGYIFLVSFISLFGLGIAILVSNKFTESTWVRAEAVVDRLIGSETNPMPVLKFYTEDGLVQYVNRNVGSANAHVGNKVEIFYNPEDPSEVETKTNSIVAIIFIGLSFVFLLLGLYLRKYKDDLIVTINGDTPYSNGGR